MSSTPVEISSQKKALRKKLLSRRAALSQAQPQAAQEAARICLSLLTLDTDLVIAAYHPIGTELHTEFLLKSLWYKGIRCALPRVGDAAGPLTFHLYQQGDRLEDSAFGVAEPLASAAVMDPDVIIVPLLGFDKDGFRLGYGGGFYDRTLSGLRRRKRIVAIGYGFAGQEVAEIPREDHDEPLDAIVTDQGAFRLER